MITRELVADIVVCAFIGYWVWMTFFNES